ncbi:MAG: glycosyltransferase family 39 protein [Anaerolineae bacterium]|nr:glycosyltransferase family 39 protein [Anaerolineae bacterium]
MPNLSERQKNVLAWSILALEWVVGLGWLLAHLGGFQWSSDEGIYLMRVRLLRQRYALYRDIWTDQLPGLIEGLWLAFALVGERIEAGRALIALSTMAGLAGATLLTWRLFGRAGALTVSPMLMLMPNVLWLSRAIDSPDLPSTSLGVLAFALLVWANARKKLGLLILSALSLALGLYVKATALLVAPACLWWFLDEWRSAVARRSRRVIVARLALWGGIVVLALGSALALHDVRALWQQFVGTQVSGLGMELKIWGHAVKIWRYLGQSNWGLATLAAAGLAWGLSEQRYRAVSALGAWLGGALVALLVRSPMWPRHHLVVLLPPMAILAGGALQGLWNAWRQGSRRGIRELLEVAALIYLLSVPGILCADAQWVWPASPESAAAGIAYLQETFPQGAVTISDYHMIPYRAGCSVPPFLATVSKKRFQLGLLSAQDLVDISERSRPGAVVLWDEQLESVDQYLAWVKRHYVLGFVRGYHQIYVAPEALPLRHEQPATFAGEVELLGYSYAPLAADPGGSIGVRLYWRALGPISRELRGFAHLVDEQERALAQDDHLVSSLGYRPTAWAVGETIIDDYDLAVPADAAPGTYFVSVGLYDRETGERLPGRSGPAQLSSGETLGGDQVVLSIRPLVRWPAREVAFPVAYPAEARFGDLAHLVGYDLQVDSEGPPRVVLSLEWQATASVDWPEYKVFVHLRQDGDLVGQHDGPPGEGQRRTVGWRAGEYVSDRHELPLGADLSGELQVYVGLYDAATLTRLPVWDAQGQALPSDELLLTEIQLGGAP